MSSVTEGLVAESDGAGTEGMKVAVGVLREFEDAE